MLTIKSIKTITKSNSLDAYNRALCSEYFDDYDTQLIVSALSLPFHQFLTEWRSRLIFWPMERLT